MQLSYTSELYRHPFNCEPPPEVLMKKAVALNGYTPSSLHYVRNHGPTPRMDWASHTVEVGGLVDKPHTFTMDEIVSLPSITIPITLVKVQSLSYITPRQAAGKSFMISTSTDAIFADQDP